MHNKKSIEQSIIVIKTDFVVHFFLSNDVQFFRWHFLIMGGETFLFLHFKKFKKILCLVSERTNEW
jgi:hypothetical protein